MTSKTAYLKNGRLADVLALIQVLAMDKDSHRSLSGLKDELQSTPRSATSWKEIANGHPEFFRVETGAKFDVSLIARHATPKNENGIRPLPADYTSKLLLLAVELHDREMRRSQSWQAWLPLLGVVIGGLITHIASK